MNEAKIEEYWQGFKEKVSIESDHYEAWGFGDSKEMADELAELVRIGIKTATASNYTMYELENEEVPAEGLYNILLNGSGDPVAIIQTTEVEVVPFDEVSEEHAYLEGEGDRSLDFWRREHEVFFKRELAETNRDFHDKLPVVLERFKVVHLAD
jgi:uncharacterized protein YhfF